MSDRDDFLKYKEKAEAGDADAQHSLGLCYETGKGVAVNLSEAAVWYGKAAERGHVLAMYHLGLCYMNGDGVEQNYGEALELFWQANLEGLLAAQFCIGLCYENGYGVEKDLSEAVRFYENAASQGYDRAEYNLAMCYAEGKGVKKDAAEAFKWHTRAAGHGQPDAQYALGVCYLTGEGTSENIPEGMRWIRKAAENGLVKAQVVWGTCCLYGDCGVDTDYAEAAKWLKKACESGFPDARYHYAFCLANGYGVERDTDEAFRLYEELAEEGNAAAQVMTGMFCFNGLAGGRDPEKAGEWYKKAAEGGSVEAMTLLGELLLNRGDSESDFTEAVRLLEKASAENDSAAMYLLALCYMGGNGVEKDTAKAVDLLTKSAELEYDKAEYLLGRCCLLGDMVEEDEGRALELFAAAARQGNINALFYFARRCEDLAPERGSDFLDRAVYIYEKIVERQDNQLLKDDDGDLAYVYYRLAGIKNDPDLDERKNLEIRKELYEKAKGYGFPCEAQIAATKRAISELVGEEFKDRTGLDLLVERMNSSNDALGEIPREVSTLLESMFGDVWSLLGHSVKQSLETGLATYVTNAVMEGKGGSRKDFSSVTVNLCKAVEIILNDVFVKNYIPYLGSEGVEASYFTTIPHRRWDKGYFPFVELEDKQYRYKSWKNSKILTLGNLCYFTGLDYGKDGVAAGGSLVSSPGINGLEKNMAKYCDEKVFKSDAFLSAEKRSDAVENYMEALVWKTKNLAERFRNKSAHKGVMNKSMAAECIETVVLRDACLVDFVSKVKSELL